MMAILFEELEGSPSLSVTDRGTNGTRVFKVAWNDRLAFALELTGQWIRIGSVDFRLVPPKPFPGLPLVVVKRVEIVPFDLKNPDGSDITTISTGTNRYSAGAKVTAHYETVADSDDDQEKPDTPEGTVLTYSSELGAEYMTLPGRAWYWSGTNVKLAADVTPGVMMPTGIHTLKWERVANPPWGTIRGLRGKVNNSAFLGAGTGKMLFLGGRAHRQFDFSRDVNMWTVEYQFAERAEEWNKFYRAGFGWTEIDDQAGGGGSKPYASGDFNTLFQFGS